MLTYGQKIFIMLLGSSVLGLIGFFFLGDAAGLLCFFLPSVVLLVKIEEKVTTLINMANKNDDEKKELEYKK